MVRNFSGGFAKNLPKQTLDSISDDGAADFAGNCQPQSMVNQIVHPAKEYESL
jgi:hypothetical protein